MTRRIKSDKWILYRHTKSFKMICEVALLLKKSEGSITNEDKTKLLLQLRDLGFYNERNPELPHDSINHRINTLSFFMFGYKYQVNGKKIFLFSPLGNLFLDNLHDFEKITKIFFTMLWAVQFEHPYSPTGTPKLFSIYPFRLIFKLLTDERLEKKLFSHEEAHLIAFVEHIENDQQYENLIKEILDMRTWSNQKIEDCFKLNEHLYVNAVYEWDYYVSKIIEAAGIIVRTEGETICRLNHGSETKRILKRNCFQLSKDAHDYCIKLMKDYPFDQSPAQLDDPTKMKSDVVKQIYNFFPQVLLKEINEAGGELDKICSLLELPKKLEEYSNNKDNAQAYLFEDILAEAFNMFVNVRAKKIGGPESVDVECLYTDMDEGKFGVDGKSRKGKLAELNPTRLKRHREKIGGRYTIVVPPRFMPGALEDIRSTNNVILTSDTFSEFLYNCIVNNVRDVDYTDFENIIQKKMGGDISPDISALTMNKFGISADPIL
jgi:hypothetical protein